MPLPVTPAGANPYGSLGNLQSRISNDGNWNTNPDFTGMPDWLRSQYTQTQQPNGGDDGGYTTRYQLGDDHNPFGGFKDENGQYLVQLGNPDDWGKRVDKDFLGDPSKAFWRNDVGWVARPQDITQTKTHLGSIETAMAAAIAAGFGAVAGPALIGGAGQVGTSGTMTGLAGDESAGLSMANPFTGSGSGLEGLATSNVANPYGPGAFDSLDGGLGSSGSGINGTMTGAAGDESAGLNMANQNPTSLLDQARAVYNSQPVQTLKTANKYRGYANTLMNLINGGQTTGARTMPGTTTSGTDTSGSNSSGVPDWLSSLLGLATGAASGAQQNSRNQQFSNNIGNMVTLGTGGVTPAMRTGAQGEITGLYDGTLSGQDFLNKDPTLAGLRDQAYTDISRRQAAGGDADPLSTARQREYMKYADTLNSTHMQQGINNALQVGGFNINPSFTADSAIRGYTQLAQNQSNSDLTNARNLTTNGQGFLNLLSQGGSGIASFLSRLLGGNNSGGYTGNDLPTGLDNWDGYQMDMQPPPIPDTLPDPTIVDPVSQAVDLSNWA